MYNLGDDKELDRLSREAAGRYTPPGEANWQALSEELDRIMPVTEKKKRRFLFWWLLPFLLIGGGATYWLGTHRSTDDATRTTLASPSARVPGEAMKESQPAVLPNAAAGTDQQSVRRGSRSDQPASAQTTATGPTEVSPQAIASLPTAKTNPGRQQSRRLDKPVANHRSSTTKEMTDDIQTISTSTAAITSDKKADIPLSSTQTNTTKISTVVTDPLQKTETKQAQNSSAERTTTPATITEPAPSEATAPAVAKVIGNRGRGFSYAFVAGVDKSTVKFVYGNDPGINIGAMGGYHFNDRWSVHTGLIYTQKNYKVAGKDFTAPKGTWVSYYNLESITGYCRMWEVPLQVRYTMGKSEHKNSFFSAGLSSYFMTKESYDYFYYYNNQPVTRNSTLNSDDRHILSILHFSVGFENKVSRYWGLQIEPYAKIPLGGVGFGNIRLSSFGVNFSLQHRQPARK